MAADVVRLLDHLKVKKAHLVGYSMGTFIAAKVAATHPDRVLSVVYGGQAPLFVGAKASGSREVEVFAEAVEADKGLGPYLLEVLPKDKPKPTLEQANSLTKLMFSGKDVKALAAAGLSFSGLRVTVADLRKCKAPAIFLYGANESADTKDSIAYARTVLFRSEEKIIEGGDHISAVTKPAFGATIVSFLKAHRIGGLH
jgi:pimeloyl-ACP methyl ester carboxylesterase